MCGFGGVVNSSQIFHYKFIENIANQVNFRGPDNTGIAIYNNSFKKSKEGNNAFFFNRLSIIDLDYRSNQPFENDRYTLLFNGEIYNYIEIKNKLLTLGIDFKTTSDTEVLFQALIKWGKDCIIDLNGMFSFFFIDKLEQKVLLARDRVGIKPLYYTQEQRSLIFGSELDSILRLTSERASISYDSVKLYLRLQYVPTPFSIYENIYKLAPGSYIECLIQELNNLIQLKQVSYWDAYKTIKKEVQINDTLESLLASSVKNQLQSDVPLGLFLSSGIDSSLLTAIVNKYFSKNQEFKFFTVAFEQKTMSDESFEASSFLKGFNNPNFSHHKLIISSEYIKDSLYSIYDFFDEPFGDYASLLNWSISKKAKELVTVVLSGDGADELFWGYFRYADFHGVSNSFYSKLSLIKPLLRRFCNYYTQRICQKIENNKLDIYLNLVSSSLPGGYSEFSESNLWFVEGINEFLKRDDLPFIVDLKTYLPDCMLYKVDKTSMAASLEVRVPYLDNYLVDYALKLSLSEKSNSHFANKAPLKQLLLKLAPHYNFEMPKRGFSFPLRDWLFVDYKEIVQDTISTDLIKDLGLNSKFTNSVLEKHYSGKRDSTLEIWYLLNLTLWYKKFKNLNYFK